MDFTLWYLKQITQQNKRTKFYKIQFLSNHHRITWTLPTYNINFTKRNYNIPIHFRITLYHIIPTYPQNLIKYSYILLIHYRFTSYHIIPTYIESNVITYSYTFPIHYRLTPYHIIPTYPQNLINTVISL